jgi:2-polyprenyl-6-methoxyphenol hydroxylase-like FAD-dependent oxidoreductase
VTGVLVVGAGIGGLAAALSMHAAGVECMVVDKVRELTSAGVGINLQPHAVRELDELGVGVELAGLGVPTSELVHYDRFGNRIWGQPRGIAAGYRWPQYSVHRGELQMLLLRAVRERLGAGVVRTGVAFDSCTETAGGVRARLRNRGSGELMERDVDVLVGADGLYSAVRAHLHPGEGPPIGSGIRMWRGTALQAPFLTGRSMIMAGRNTAAKFVAYPISPVIDGLATINWVAEVRQPDDGRTASWTARGRLADVLPHYADWRFDWLDVPELIRSSEPILEYPMVDRDPLAQWGSDRITLVGDAAHPMYPIGSNGGSQAILDARVLAYHLATAPEVPTALAGYERQRREPTTAIVLANRDLGPEPILRTVAERAPNGFQRIEDVLSAQELATIDDAYRSTTSTDVAALNTRASWSGPFRAQAAGRLVGPITDF